MARRWCRNRIESRFQNQTLWLKQALFAELFEIGVRSINEHLQNLLEEGALDPESTIRKFRIVLHEDKRAGGRLIEHYSLAAIMAQFRTAINTRYKNEDPCDDLIGN